MEHLGSCNEYVTKMKLASLNLGEETGEAADNLIQEADKYHII